MMLPLCMMLPLLLCLFAAAAAAAAASERGRAGGEATQALRGDAGWEDALRRAAKHLAEALILTERTRHEQRARPCPWSH